MIKEYIKTVPKNIYEDLERDQLTVDNLNYLISYMIEHDMTDSPRYEQYSRELVEANIKYIKDKHIFEQGIASSLNNNEKLIHWNLKFADNKLTYSIKIED